MTPDRPTATGSTDGESQHDEQTLSDAEQTLGDTDQTLADSDQTAADTDQVSSDRDQAASDRDLRAGADPSEHERSRGERQQATRERHETARIRLETATARDEVATARDLAARARDLAADARDRSLALLAEGTIDGHGSITGAELMARAAEQRRRAAVFRDRAAEHRRLAAEDRAAAAADREQAERDRLGARADLEALARQLALAETDPLTGARTRAAGLADLDHELERCRRTGAVLVLAYLDVVGLKQVNDSEGHAAGDELLREVVEVVRAHLRPYDLVVRMGGDEFLCAMSGMAEAEARERFDAIGTGLREAPRPCTIRTGFGQLQPGEDGATLIARADAQLLDQRTGRPGSGPASGPGNPGLPT